MASYVKLIVYDAVGKEIVKLADENYEAGRFSVTFDATQYTSGAYFCSIEIKGTDGTIFLDSKKMLLVK